MNIISSIKSNKLKSVSIVIFALMLFILFFLYSNKVAPVSWNFYGSVNIDEGIAIQGGDVVAYQTEGRFVPGVSKFSHKTEDAIWYFASDLNKQRFIKSPEKYMPQYGGYCAFAITQGVTADAKPEHWTIKNGKLYLFNDAEVKDTWLQETKNGSITTGDANWATRL